MVLYQDKHQYKVNLLFNHELRMVKTEHLQVVYKYICTVIIGSSKGPGNPVESDLTLIYIGNTNLTNGNCSVE